MQVYYSRMISLAVQCPIELFFWLYQDYEKGRSMQYKGARPACGLR